MNDRRPPQWMNITTLVQENPGILGKPASGNSFTIRNAVDMFAQELTGIGGEAPHSLTSLNACLSGKDDAIQPISQELIESASKAFKGEMLEETDLQNLAILQRQLNEMDAIRQSFFRQRDAGNAVTKIEKVPAKYPVIDHIFGSYRFSRQGVEINTEKHMFKGLVDPIRNEMGGQPKVAQYMR